MSDKKSNSGRLIILEAVPAVVGAVAYAAGDNIGGKLTFNIPNFGAGLATGFVLKSVVVTDLSGQAAALDLLLFDEDPSGSTFTDNAAQAIADADLVKSVGFVQITSYAALATSAIGRGEINRDIPIIAGAGAQLFGAVVARGTPTYVSVVDLRVRLGLEAI